jgi:hypothetical protein
MTAQSRRQPGRDEYPSRYDIIGAASGIQGLIDWGDEHPLIVEHLLVALRVLRRVSRLDPPGEKATARGPTALEAPSDQQDLAIARRLLDRLLDNPELADAKIREPVAIAAALIERANMNPDRDAADAPKGRVAPEPFRQVGDIMAARLNRVAVEKGWSLPFPDADIAEHAEGRR